MNPKQEAHTQWPPEIIAKSDELIDNEVIKELQLLADVRTKFEMEFDRAARSLREIYGVNSEDPELAALEDSMNALFIKTHRKIRDELTAIMQREIERND